MRWLLHQSQLCLQARNWLPLCRCYPVMKSAKKFCRLRCFSVVMISGTQSFLLLTMLVQHAYTKALAATHFCTQLYVIILLLWLPLCSQVHLQAVLATNVLLIVHLYDYLSNKASCCWPFRPLTYNPDTPSWYCQLEALNAGCNTVVVHCSCTALYCLHAMH